jgi:hypothetical protein
MAYQIDAIFSPDRLRKNWKKPLSPVIVETQNISNINIHSQYSKLQCLISENYTGFPHLLPDAMKYLTAKIDLMFDINKTTPADAGQIDVVLLLEELEELLWAMELEKKAKQ